MFCMTQKDFWLHQANKYKEHDKRKAKICEVLAEWDKNDLHALFDMSVLNNVYLGYMDLGIAYAKKHNDFTEEQLEAIKQVRYDCYCMLDIYNAEEAENYYIRS